MSSGKGPISSALSAIPLLLAVAAGGLCAQPDDTRPAQSARALLERWIALEQQRGSLETQWRSQKQQLEQRRELLEQEKTQLERTLRESDAGNDDVEQERGALLEQQQQLEREQQRLGDTLERLSPLLRAALPRLPPPLARGWERQLETLASAEGNSEKLQAVLRLLESLADFQQRVSAHESVITLDDGESLLARQLYLGAARGWFVTADGRHSGRGEALREGWRWTLDPAVDPQTVFAALDMLELNRDIAFVALPLNLPAGDPQQ